MNVTKVGTYIRKQREGARLSLSKVSGLAGVSIPYLSQIERGLRRPSADILQSIAGALRISAETLYVQAGILQDRTPPDVTAAILADQTISEGQRRALLQIYQTFRAETVPNGETTPRSGRGAAASRRRRKAPPVPPASKSERRSDGP